MLKIEFPDDREIGAPVLFMHAREGVLFDPVTGKGLQDIPFSRDKSHTAQAVFETHKRNIICLEADKEKFDDPDIEKKLHNEREELKRLKAVEGAQRTK